MVMGCVFKHHVYLCIVSTAMLAGLSLITSHTKAYAQNQNCTIVSNLNGPIVCDGGKGGNGMLNTSSDRGGSKIEIKMDMSKHSGKEAVKITGGANIIATKKLKVTGAVKGSGKNLPVIKVDGSGGKLMLLGGVDVDGGAKIKGSGGNGKVVGVQMGGTEKLVMMRNVIFEGVTEGINIKGGGRRGAANVMGMGTMTVNGSGVVGIKVEDTGTIDATVMGLKIEGSGGSKGVEFKGTGTGGKGTLTLNSVDVSGFETGVSASKGKLVMMGGWITIKENGGKGYGLNMQGEANAELMRTRIVGDRRGDGTGSNSTGVVMGSEGTLMLTSVDISNVGVSVEKGMVNIMGNSTITVKENGTGLSVSGTGNATMMGAEIKGEGGKGMYGVKMMGSGTVKMMGGTIMVKGGAGNGNYGVGVSGGAVTMMGTEIVGTSGGTGVYMGSGGKMTGSGTVEMTSVGISNVEKGYGIEVWGKATTSFFNDFKNMRAYSSY
ncbi:hypothetical protein m02_01810 [Bartonella bovis m02]|uniref:Right handed beta helix domain-containing protein n=2 Tax=Bartonella bovis TaxID=155194 RepID=N6UVD9_9HYPH|nr:hypothetical protein m02_01810 [Bartonella bovis m02]